MPSQQKSRNKTVAKVVRDIFEGMILLVPELECRDALTFSDVNEPHPKTHMGS